ncbi:MAG: aldo/keto reductase [Myxococcota bacterium]
MEYRKLGNTGVRVSTLCLGTMTFGEAKEGSFMHQVGCDEATSFQLMNEALDGGVNFIDTADIYGHDGLTERVVGAWFENDHRRDEVVLATKFRFRMHEGPNGTGASRYHIVRAVEESLRRLKTDRIDLYQIHMQDVETPEEETLRALDDLVHAGKVLYIGASNYAAYRLSGALWTSRLHGLASYCTLQTQYSLVRREIEREHVPLCREHGLGILPWSPLAGGFLTGKYQRDQHVPSGSRMEKWEDQYKRFDSERNWEILDAVTKIANAVDTTPAAVSLAWLIRKPSVTSVIFGARSSEQLKANLAAATLELTPEHIKTLDEASAIDMGYPYDFIGRVQNRW